MVLKIELGSFYSHGDERRLFDGFKEIPAIRGVKGCGRGLLIDINVQSLGKKDMRELLALLWRYGIPLSPLRALATRKRFEWLNDPVGYWHSSMFGTNADS